MSNKRKKRKSWLQLDLGLDKQKYSNSIQQHQDKIDKESRKFDQDGIEYFDDEQESYSKNSYDWSSYDWGWGESLHQEKSYKSYKNKEDRKSYFDEIGSKYSKDYSNYESSGQWRGYSSYRTQKLSYKYVQQMASALSAEHNIKIKIGKSWQVDLLNKELTYNPTSLVYGTKGELLATLFHEIGKLRYMEHYSKLRNKYITMYENPAVEVLNTFEDMRIDYLMLKAYDAAAEIYESAIPGIERLVEKYKSAGQMFRKLIPDTFESEISNIVYKLTQEVASSIIVNNSTTSSPPNFDANALLESKLRSVLGVSDKFEINARIQRVRDYYQVNGTYFEYCGRMLEVMYDFDKNIIGTFPNIEEKVEATIAAIEPSKKKSSSQELVEYLDKEVFLVVEYLLKEFAGIMQEFPQIDGDFLRMVQNNTRNKGLRSNGKGAISNMLDVSRNSNDMSASRISSEGTEDIPPEWLDGDYNVIKDSVSSEIRQLVQRLTFIRREELVQRYQHDQKRGKLNSKKLYKSAFSSRRLFKRKLPNIDTVQSFAFSIVIDVSGSMEGSRIAHTTRAVAIFAEVFKKLSIPFELITFSSGAKTLKGFNDEFSKSVQKMVGGMPKHLGGSTNLYLGLDLVKVQHQPEKNKVVIVLTDGGVGTIQAYDNSHFLPWQKKGIKSLGIGIECEEYMGQLCMGNSKVLEDANMLPVEFVDILKGLIKRKK